jgi:hypothetical protein
MVEPIVIAHLVGEQGGRLCSAPDAPMTLDFTSEAWAAHVRWGNGSPVIRCGRCAEVLRRASGLGPSAAPRSAWRRDLRVQLP